MASGFPMAEFLRKYTESMTLQIDAIQSQVDQSFGQVMQSLQELSASTEKKKTEADAVLENTYFNPDAGTALMSENIQKSADDIFEQAQAAIAQGGKSESLTGQVLDQQSHMRRMGGMFSKHMESISTMDDSMKDLVLTMVGSLSNTDVIKQRLDHIIEVLRALNLGLGNLIVDLDDRLNRNSVTMFKENLLDFAYKSYSIEEERDTFKAIFGSAPRVQKAYVKK